jgi:hypothetical protein
VADIRSIGVHDGDTITYTSLKGDRELTGRVEYATRDAVHVTRERVTYAVAWDRVTGHTPQGYYRDEGGLHPQHDVYGGPHDEPGGTS